LVLINIQFVRLELDVCEKPMAQEQRRRVSELVNEMLRAQLAQVKGFSAADGASL